MENNAPFAYLTVVRILSILMAYAYHGFGGLILLTWILLSFVMPTVSFVNGTVKYFIPLYIALFCYLYFINIRGFLDFCFDLFSQYGKPK
jgi:hypothetical protein